MEKPRYPSDEAAKFMLRLPAAMRDLISAAAAASGRSMNAEITHRLAQSFAAPPVAPSREEVEILIEERMRKMLANYVPITGPASKQTQLLPDEPTALESGDPIRPPPVKRKRAR